MFRVCRGGHVDDQPTRQGFESLTLTNAASKDRSGRTRPAESLPRPRGRLGPAPGRVPRRAPDPPGHTPMLIAIADGHQGHMSAASKDVPRQGRTPPKKQLKLLDQTGSGFSELDLVARQS